ncbi:hypothetical protein AAG570_013547 [Ranatra chinensis]|uniref:Uncharacterized protein n=1 Tax=Ranatra chinensis TaxID=642074 RepID=A0ABD0YCI7_9HEMI
MASKRRNMFHKNKTQETTENNGAVVGVQQVGQLGPLRQCSALAPLIDLLCNFGVSDIIVCPQAPLLLHNKRKPPQQGATLTPLVPWEVETELGKTVSIYSSRRSRAEKGLALLREQDHGANVSLICEEGPRDG